MDTYYKCRTQKLEFFSRMNLFFRLNEVLMLRKIFENKIFVQFILSLFPDTRGAASQVPNSKRFSATITAYLMISSNTSLLRLRNWHSILTSNLP
jgi:hypothetical protein